MAYQDPYAQKPQAATAAPASNNGLDSTNPVPSTPPTQSAAPAQSYSVNQFQDWAKQRYGRSATDAELQKIGAHVGAPGANGAYTQDQYTKAQGYSDQLAAQMGWKNPGAAPTTPAPTAPVDPGVQTNNLVQQQIQQLLTSGSTPAMSNVDMNNPAIQAQRTAFARANAQGAEQSRLAAAERGAARGTLGAGGYDAELGAIEQNKGNQAANFESQMLTGELQGQRDRVMQAMSLAANSGNATMARELQERLTLLDNEIRKSGLSLQGQLGKGQLSLGLLQALMGDQRAKDALGFNYTSLGVNANQNFMNSILANL